MNGETDSPTIRMVGGRRMQCKDIPDEVFLDAVRQARASANCGWRTRWEVHAELELAVGMVPENLLMAKARKLIARRLMGGCACGCRGDWHPADECVDGVYCCRPRREAANGSTYRLSATDKAGNPVEVRLVPLPGFGFDAAGWYDVSADGVKTYRAPARVEGTLNGRLFPWAVGLLCGTPGRPSSLNAAYRQRQRNRVKRRRR